ncbi:endolytic transglycosylase MltG [Frigoribacterium sp. 2-23]|uniref:endolytic transglycosylase MltG n=1 Tax=Frigoribacterium sp. 2-23 TaxID=3415006 RepID=UPI003C6FC61A
MADEPNWDEIFSSQPTTDGGQGDRRSESRGPAADTAAAPATSRREQRERERSPRRHERDTTASAPRPPRPGRRRGAIILVVILVVVLGGGTAGVLGAWNTVAPKVEALFGDNKPEDFSGTGNGTEVDFPIVDGQVGSDIAQNLFDAGVTKSYQAAYSILLANKTITFQVGTYKLEKEMSAQSAIDALQDDSKRIVNKVVVPEGTALKDIIPLVAQATGLPVADVQAAADDYTSYGLPAEAKSLEGYLFPATYQLAPNKTAHDYLQEMVTTMFDRLQKAGVQPADYQHTIVFASLIQREAGLADDYPKVARVFQNRLDDGMLLQSDATVAYGTGNTHTVTTTDAERADASNPYNTYVHQGLPAGPISNPGDLAINAALHPADGPWLYFVTVNLATGETDFSTTFAEHQASVKKWQQWMRDNPSY